MPPRRSGTAPSIPSTVHVVRRARNDIPREAFGSRCSRFGTQSQGEMSRTPGPGFYAGADQSRVSSALASPSVSRKGYGVGFVSKSKRFPWTIDDNNPLDDMPMDTGPGPGQYYRPEVTHGASPWHKLTAAPVHERQTRTGTAPTPPPSNPSRFRSYATQVPGPGHYNTPDMINPVQTSRTYASSFRSSKFPESGGGARRRKGRGRGRNNSDKPTPAPGQYHRPIDYTKNAAKFSKSTGTWTFKSSATRAQPDKPGGGSRVSSIGPGVYDVTRQQELTWNAALAAKQRPRTAQQRGRPLLSMASADGPDGRENPRPATSLAQAHGYRGNAGAALHGLTQERRNKPCNYTPGPGAYNVKVEGQSNGKAVQSVFQSRTTRRVVSRERRAVPGPAFYNNSTSSLHTRTSFLLNARRKWV